MFAIQFMPNSKKEINQRCLLDYSSSIIIFFSVNFGKINNNLRCDCVFGIISCVEIGENFLFMNGCDSEAKPTHSTFKEMIKYMKIIRYNLL